MLKRFGSPRHYHLKDSADFQRAFRRRRSVSDEWLIVYACENGLTHVRLGMSVSKKMGKAIVRNRLRRLYREAFRLSQADLPAGLDLVIIPKRRAELPTLAALLQSIPRLAERAARKIRRDEARQS